MKNSVAPNRKTGRMITKNLIVLLVLVFIAFISMWAWFTERQEASASGIGVECKASDNIEIAIVPHGAPAPKPEDYVRGSIMLKDQEFIRNIVLTELTSDGVSFYKPMLTQSNGIAKPDVNAEWEVAVPNENYLSFDLYFRSKTSYNISITPNSKFTPVSTILTGADSGNKSDYGDFSKDCIVGAARFSVVNDDDRKLLWIPRPDLMFSTADGVSTLTENVGPADFDGVTYKHSYYEVFDNQKRLAEMDSKFVSASVKNSDGEYVLPQKTDIALMSKLGDDGYYTKSVVCNMWIEGEDTEARLALVKGQFKISLDLTVK